MAEGGSNEDSHVLHVVVIGFHHKKGCQVEYSYPPLIVGNPVDSHQTPEEWKHLPSLALPDGAHNYLKDTVYFHLPGRNDDKRTVYGVSCYRQMDAKDLKNRGSEVTRSTVQKSVCVLSRLPLYGLIKAKLELITHAYFDERDFTKVELLEQTYLNMKTSLSEHMLGGSQVFLGLSARDLVMLFKHKIVLLFKLVLLERRVLFFGAPVETLGGVILSLLSLFPGMVEHGLDEAVCRSDQKVTSTLKLSGSEQEESDGYLEISYTDPSSVTLTHTEPLSPFIPRDQFFPSPLVHSYHSDGNSAHAQPVSDRSDDLTGQGRDTDNCTKSQGHNQIDLAEGQGHNHDNLASVHGQNHRKGQGHSNSDHVKVHGHNNRISSPPQSSPVGIGNQTYRTSDTEGSSGSVPTSEIVFARESSPLQDLYSITQVQAVQSTVEIESCDEVATETTLDDPQGKRGRTDLSILIANERPGVHSTSSVDIEDLDSPESISKIDREDCFSWEDDRLLLAIHDDQDIKPTPEERPDSNPDSTHKTSDSSVQPSTKGDDSDPADSRGSSRHSSPGVKAAMLKSKLSSAFGNLRSKGKGESSNVEMRPLYGGPELHQDQAGFPLAVFTRGTVCHPYLSLQYHDILNDVTIRSFVIGATNILFKQRRNLLDVVVEIEDGKIEIHDRELQKHLHLTTADLRFGEYIVKTVIEEKDVYLDGTEWEGGDEWIRAQFRLYLQSLLATMLQDDVKLQEDFGGVFISTWKTTNNYRYWSSAPHPSLHHIPTGHPFQGHLNMNDIRVRLAHTMQNTERGKKLNAAVVQTGKYMVETGKAVGGALTNAKSAVSSWFSSWRQEKPSTSTETTSPTLHES